MVHHKLKGTGPKMKKIMQLLLIGVLCFAYSFSALADADESTVKKVQPACRTFALRQEGGAHNEASWARLVPGMMRFLWEG